MAHDRFVAGDEEGARKYRRRFSRRVVLTMLIIILILIALITTFIVLYIQKDDSSGGETSTSNKVQQQVCTTDVCNKHADKMLAMMNTQANPCQDFNQYACGGFIKAPFDDGFTDVQGPLDQKDRDLLKGILAEPVEHQSGSSFERKLKTLYKECMDVDAMEKYGLQDYTTDARQDWPSLNHSWEESSYDLQTLVNKYMELMTTVLFEVQVYEDQAGPDAKWYLSIDYKTGLIWQSVLRQNARNSSLLMAYESYYRDFAVALGADPTTATGDAMEVVDFHKKLSEEPSGGVEQPESTNGRTTLKDLNGKYPYLNWVTAVQSLFHKHTTLTIVDTQDVEVNLPFLTRLWELLQITSKRTIQNTFGFLHANRLVGEATKELREINSIFQEIVTEHGGNDPDGEGENGQETEEGGANGRRRREVSDEPQARSNFCVEVIKKIYNKGLGKLLAKIRLPVKDQATLHDMMATLKEGYRLNMGEMTWMSSKTKEQALLKLDKMNYTIGVPRERFGNVDLDERYRNYKVDKKNFNPDWNQNKEQKRIQKYELLNQVQGKSIVDEPSLIDADAWHLNNANEVFFPLSYMQWPNFVSDRPSYLNYGGFGVVMGHEIGHGFDPEVKEYDERGSVRDWFQPVDRQKYDTKAECFKTQYNKYPMEESLRWEENVADNLGLSNGYRAYQLHSQRVQELPLPKLGLDNNQLFFVAYAQSHCSKDMPGTLPPSPKDAPKPINARLFGPIQNTAGFAKAFHCKATDVMNPTDKCVLW